MLLYPPYEFRLPWTSMARDRHNFSLVAPQISITINDYQPHTTNNAHLPSNFNCNTFSRALSE